LEWKVKQIDIGWANIVLFPAAPYSMCDASPVCVVGVAFERQRGVHAIGSDRRVDFDAWPGEVALAAPQVNIFSESMAGGEYLAVHVAPGMLHRRPDASMGPPRVVFPGDRRAIALAWRLRLLMLAAQPDTLRIEEQAALFMARIAQPRTTHGRYHPDRRVHARVLDYIEAALDGPLTLADLAHLAEMPLLRFLRSFASATGTTPHAYMTERRLQRARHLLCTTDDPVAAIALDCGFSHQSHLGTALRQRMGLRPLQYRNLYQRKR
jgi:AraC family transcriptional regulator